MFKLKSLLFSVLVLGASSAHAADPTWIDFIDTAPPAYVYGCDLKSVTPSSHQIQHAVQTDLPNTNLYKYKCGKIDRWNTVKSRGVQTRNGYFSCKITVRTTSYHLFGYKHEARIDHANQGCYLKQVNSNTWVAANALMPVDDNAKLGGGLPTMP